MRTVEDNFREQWLKPIGNTSLIDMSELIGSKKADLF